MPTGSVSPKPGIDVLDYLFDVTLSESSDTVAVNAYVTFQRSPAGPDRLSLDLIGMTVDTVGYTNAVGFITYVPYSDTASARCIAQTGDNWPAMCLLHIQPVRFQYDGRVLRVPIGKRPTVTTSDHQNYELVSVSYHGVPQDGLIQGTNAHGHRVVFADNWPQRAR